MISILTLQYHIFTLQLRIGDLPKIDMQKNGLNFQSWRNNFILNSNELKENLKNL